MDEKIKLEIMDSVREFSLPRYNEIPNVGLYLEQTAKYISEYLQPLGDMNITGSMISNYVKKGLLPNPVKKQYFREQIAWLIFIAVVKAVVSIDDIKLLLELQRKTYDIKVAYDYFCSEFENVLYYTFGIKDNLDKIGVFNSGEKDILKTAIVAVVHKVYLDKCFKLFREGN